MLDMLRRIEPDARIFYLDTGVLFPETLRDVDGVEERYGVQVRALPQHLPRGAGRAARRRAVEARARPLLRDPQGRAAAARARPASTRWITGVRRDQAPDARQRAEGRVGRASSASWKANPLADWTREGRLAPTSTSTTLPYNPLHDRGYAVDRLHALHA